MPAYDDDESLFDDDAHRRARKPGGGGDSWDVEDGDNLPDQRDIPPDDLPTIRCTQCKKLIFENLPRCPYCGHMQLEDDHRHLPLWFLITIIFCIALLGGFSTLYILGLLRPPTWRLP